jgi:tripartite-type tricarboxylate transporter receptor subunit TctC
MAPRGIPEDVRLKLIRSVSKVLAMPEVKDKIAATGLDPAVAAGAEFQEFLRQQYETYGKVIRSKQISLSE